MSTLLLIALGGAIGASARFAVATRSNRRFRHSPVGTLFVNLSGALLLGIIASASTSHVGLTGDTYRFVTIGILGSYTTFSTLCYEAFALFEAEKPVLALLYAAGSQVAGLAAVFAGMKMVGLW